MCLTHKLGLFLLTLLFWRIFFEIDSRWEWKSGSWIKGSKIKSDLNGTVILDGDITEARKNGAMDHNDHPGLKRNAGHIGFPGHGSVVRFKNIQ